MTAAWPTTSSASSAPPSSEFKLAYARSQAPGLLFNLAQASRLNKDYEQALHFYRTYLRVRPDAPNRDDVEQAHRRARA